MEVESARLEWNTHCRMIMAATFFVSRPVRGVQSLHQWSNCGSSTTHTESIGLDPCHTTGQEAELGLS